MTNDLIYWVIASTTTIIIFFSSPCQAFIATRLDQLSFFNVQGSCAQCSQRSSPFQSSVPIESVRLLYTSNSNNNFDSEEFGNNVTSSDLYSVKIAENLAKRIVNRGFATVNHQLRRQREKLELEKKKELQRNESKRRNLELKWKFDQKTEDCDTENIMECSEPCDTCRGKGVVNCEFCKGIGYVDFGEQTQGTVGGRMEKENGGHTGIECPICDDDGHVCCQKCNGNGWIARWKT